MERSNKIGWAQVRAGIFISLALLFLALAVVMMGQKTRMFARMEKLTVVMTDVLGLKVGAPVWLAGVDVGVVNDISFSDPKKSNEVSIALDVDVNALRKIGSDSLITIKTRGLMGEKYVDITPSATYHEQPESRLSGRTTPKVDDVVQKAGATFDRLNSIFDSISRGEGTLGKLHTDATLYGNMARLTSEMKELLTTINRGEGTLGKLNRSSEPYDRMISILNRADRTLQEIQTADGTLNRLIHDRVLYTKLVNLAEKSNQAADDVRELNRKITSKEGTIGLLLTDRALYDKGVAMIGRAENSLAALEELAAKAKSGEGTAGKLLTEKELYEKMNRVVDDLNGLVKDVKENPRRYIKFSLF